ncbi:MAG: RebB family R body protein [Roseibium sp.]|nr:RebB family R body protein [Roseibium sp.]
MPPGMGPGVAMAAIYGSLAHSTGILYENAVAAQKQQTIAGDVLCFIAVLEALARSAPAAKTAASAVSDDEEVLKLLKALKAAA